MTQTESKVAGCRWFNGQLDMPIPWKVTFLTNVDRLIYHRNCCPVGRVQVDPQTILCGSVKISTNLRYKSNNIGWATSAAKPRLTMMITVTRQGVSIVDRKGR